MTDNRYSIIAEQIQRIFAGGDSSEDNELDIREVELLVSQAHANLIKIDYFNNLKAEGLHGVNGQFKTTIYKLPIKLDEDRQEKYVELPKQYLNLPHGKGLDFVSEWNKPKAKPILITTAGHDFFSEGQLWSHMEGHFTCYPEGSRVYFSNKTNREFMVKFANVRLVLNDPSNVSADQEMAIIGEVTRILSIRRPQDKQNDGNQLAV